MFNTLLIQPLYNALLALYALIPGHDFGLAIIVFTILIRLLLWPLIRKQLHSQRAMQRLTPDIAKVRAKANGDRQLEYKLLAELYKERGISPMAALIPTFVQLPLLFSFYFVIHNALQASEISKQGYSWLLHLPHIKAVLANPDLYKISLFSVGLTKPNVILAVLAGAAQYFQSRQIMPKQVGTDSASRATAATVYIVPVVTIVFAMTLPSALALYWVVTSVVAIAQQAIILREDVLEMEKK